jgi:hypothetical protein
MKPFLLAVLACLIAAPATPSEVALPAPQRFVAAAGPEVPSFQRHVVPLLGRLGCNGRACHGSFQGQGGFRLSLFGYDFKADHDALLGGDKPRVDRQNATQSLALRKPTRQVAHKGGKRLEVDGWEYHLLLRWMRAGAPGTQAADPSFVALDVEPREIVFTAPGSDSGPACGRPLVRRPGRGRDRSVPFSQQR